MSNLPSVTRQGAPEVSGQSASCPRSAGAPTPHSHRPGATVPTVRCSCMVGFFLCKKVSKLKQSTLSWEQKAEQLLTLESSESE